jgi:hypothetical protein
MIRSVFRLRFSSGVRGRGGLPNLIAVDCLSVKTRRRGAPNGRLSEWPLGAPVRTGEPHRGETGTDVFRCCPLPGMASRLVV